MQARRRDEEITWGDWKKEITEGTESPSGESLSTSVEVLTGNSEAFSVQEERIVLSNRVQQKPKSQLHKLKVGDDSYLDLIRETLKASKFLKILIFFCNLFCLLEFVGRMG